MRFKKRSYSRMKENRINCDQFMEAKIDVNRNKNGHLVFEPFDIDSSLIFDGKDSTKFHSNQLLIVHNDSGEINRRSFRNRSSSNESNRFCLLNSLRSAAIYSQSTIVLILIIVFFINSLHYSEAKNFQSQETAVLSPSIKCNKTLADQNVRWLYFFDDPDRKAPFDHKSFQEFCDQTNQKELSVKDYAKKCLAKFPRQITSLLMFGIIRKNKQLCSKTKLRNEMIHASNCLNAMKTKGSRCFNRAIQDLLIVKHMQLKDRVGRLCCVYFNWKNVSFSKHTKRQDHVIQKMLQ
ncbi:hypothetical protein SSS_03087 [Sarcoptes scabiei]|nr:hypothetical protein SSS_03087 [Sarcoptes scabiei]